MRGVVQGVSPSLEEAAQTLRASRAQTFRTVTLPLLKPGLANAFLVGFIESMADFGNPVVVGGQYSVLSTEIFFAIVGAQFDQGRAAALALLLTAFALTVFFVQQRVLGRAAYTTVSGKGDAGLPMPLPDGVKRHLPIVSVEEGWPQCGMGATVADAVARACFDDLDAPVERVHGADVPMSYNKHHEHLILPDAAKVAQAVKAVCYRD